MKGLLIGLLNEKICSEAEFLEFGLCNARSTETWLGTSRCPRNVPKIITAKTFLPISNGTRILAAYYRKMAFPNSALFWKRKIIKKIRLWSPRSWIYGFILPVVVLRQKLDTPGISKLGTLFRGT